MVWSVGRDELNMRSVGIEIDSFDAMKCLEVEMSYKLMTFTFRKMQSDVWRVFVQKLWDICLISFTEVVFVHLHLRHKKIKLNVHMSHTG